MAKAKQTKLSLKLLPSLRESLSHSPVHAQQQQQEAPLTSQKHARERGDATVHTREMTESKIN